MTVKRAPRHLIPTCFALAAATLLSGQALAGTISTVSPGAARLDVVGSKFTVTGTGLSLNKIQIADCVKTAADPIDQNTPTLVDVRCTPTLPGKKAVSLAGVVQQNVEIKVDHPTRMGDVAARGVPAVQGVSSFNGNFFHQATDMVVPGRGPAFTVSRAYNSYYAYLEGAQRGAVDNYRPWRNNWELQIGYSTAPGQTKEQVYVQRPDGSGANFWKDSTTNAWVPIDQGSFEKLVFDAPSKGQVTLFSRDGLRYIFQAPVRKTNGTITLGSLLKVSDHDGNSLTVTLGANKKPSKVTDASGRAFTFVYDETGKRLASVTDHTGRKVEYTWIVDAAADGSVRERIGSVRDVRGQTSTYTYSELTGGDGRVRMMLTRINMPGGGQTDISYSDQIYGDWGVQSVARKVDDNLSLTTTYEFCALDTAGACAPLDGAVGFQGKITQPDGSTRYVRFDAAGRRTATIDGKGQTSVAKPKADATLTAANYRLAGLTESSASAMNRTTALEYTDDDRGLVSKVINAALQPTQQAWQSNDDINLHTLTSRTSPSQLVSAFAYTETGRLRSIAQPGSKPTTLTYNNNTQQPGLPDTQTDPNDNTTRFAYSKQGYLTSVTNALNQVVTRTYDGLGRVTKVVDALGNATSTTYDAAGNVLKVTDPLGRTIINTYDAAGNLATSKDKRGVVTTYSYDKLNRLLSTSVALTATNNIVTRYEYDALGRVVRITNPNNNASTTSYDAAGNPLARANALNQGTSYEYNADNQVTKVTDALGRWTETEYDTAGRVIEVRTAAGLQQKYEYDADSRISRLTDALGRQTVYGYSLTTGRLESVQDPLGNITRAEYDQAGNVTSIYGPGVDGNGALVRTQHNTYDALNRRVSSLDANGNEWRTAYDANGNVISRTAPGNLVTTYSYDKLNRLTGLQLPDGQTISYTLDANGNRTQMSDSTGITTYTYDNLNRLTQLKDPQGKTIKYAYDAGSNRVSITYPGGKVVTYGFDAAERLTSVRDWLSKTTTYSLNAAGQVTAVAFGNGTSSTASYDDSARLKLLTHTDTLGVAISSQDLTREANGNIKEIATTLPLLPSFESSTTEMTYDAANRLLTLNGTPVSHDGAGRITGLSGASYSYDARDLLTSYTPASGAASSYAYNGAGHRVSKTTSGTTTRYVIDPNAELPNVLQETNAAGTVQRNYIWGYGLLSQIDAAGKAAYYHHDITGHTLALTDATGKVTDKYAYTPYGDTTTNGSTPNPFRYVGKYGVMDEGNGLHFMRARYYRADISRFLGLDQVEGSLNKPAALNRFAYGLGNPISNIDPSGLVPTASEVYFLQDQETLTKNELENYALRNEVIDSAYDLDSVWGRFGYLTAKLTNAVYTPLSLGGKTVSNAVANTAGSISSVFPAIATELSYEEARNQTHKLQDCAMFVFDMAQLYRSAEEIPETIGKGKLFIRGNTFTKKGVSTLSTVSGILKDSANVLGTAITDSEVYESCQNLWRP